jgi:hypothetical protein
MDEATTAAGVATARRGRAGPDHEVRRQLHPRGLDLLALGQPQHGPGGAQDFSKIFRI